LPSVSVAADNRIRRSVEAADHDVTDAACAEATVAPSSDSRLQTLKQARRDLYNTHSRKVMKPCAKPTHSRKVARPCAKPTHSRKVARPCGIDKKTTYFSILIFLFMYINVNSYLFASFFVASRSGWGRCRYFSRVSLKRRRVRWEGSVSQR